MSSKPALSPEVFQSHEAAFIEHYDWLFRWALQFTNNDRERAEDLAQQVFSQLIIAHTDLSRIQDIRAYLYTILRNTHRSELRLAGRSHGRSQSILEYGIADTALASSEANALFRTQEQLRRVCEYACLRKQTSRSGSVLILRFFHGYHISEIAAALGGTCPAVRQSLKFARNEARVFLDDPGALKFVGRTQAISLPFDGRVCTADELLGELRRAIFSSCQGKCLDGNALRVFYDESRITAADNATLAHIVSCAKCLDAINRKLGLPLLAERHPADALGPNNNWRDGPPSGQSGPAEASFESKRRARNQQQEISSSILFKCRRRATELFEHHPRELRVSVNGHVLGSQSVNSSTSHLRLDVTIAEPLDFVEVIGDERSRLLVMPIDPPPHGEPTQELRVWLSEGRYVEASFRHGHPWPLLEVVYHDPNFSNEPEVSISSDTAWTDSVENSLPLQYSRKPKLFNLFDSLNLLRRPFWTRPGFVSAIVSLVLIGVLLFLRVNITPTVTAANLLSRATALESVPVASDLAIRRVFELEQRRHPGGEVVNRSRIEIWRNGESGVSARRVYDGNGKLIAGEWRDSQASGKTLRRIYRRNQPQQIEALAATAQQAVRNEEFWQLEPSARDYSDLIGRADAARVREEAGNYVLEYSNSNAGNGLLQATLTLRKPDLHPIAQTLIMNEGREAFEYRFAELSFEQPRLHTLDPATFEPDAELVSKNVDSAKAVKRAAAPEPSKNQPSIAATPDLEVELAYALDKFRTRFGDQLSLTKTSAERLEVKGVVDSEETRAEILNALSHVSRHPAVRIEISTVAEVLARQQKQPNRVVQEFAGSDDAIPVYQELKDYLGAHAASGTSSERVDQMVREFAARVVGKSRRALSHAIELKQLTARFSDKQLNDLTPSTRAKLLGLVRNHAEALRLELATLRGELQPIFFTNQSRVDVTAGVEIVSDASLLLAVERLHRSVLVCDETVRSVFTASSGPATGQLVKSSRFQTELATSEKLAERVRQAAASE
ncbi:MAG TPA: sigma-70 family RNA polymerase sigma factor [Pyrinomonadaceae bacterium]|nr:sigma-70 family RNA polymerase sigma factor [Pyrinomonadaceae bacterium]